jgi:hypothetical protein
MKKLSRRTLLRGVAGGAAVSLALPPLEAMFGSSSAAASELGPIFGLFFWANGVPWHGGHGGEQAGHPDVWTPGTTGTDFAPSEMLMELARHRVTVVTGTEPKTDIPSSPPGQSDGHMRGFMVGLTGDRIRPEGFVHPDHILTALRPTLDHLIANHPDFYDVAPRFRHLALGISEARFHDYGHWNAISYRGPDAINLPILRPSQLHDQLFDVPADLVERSRRAAILDAVMDDARALKARLGTRDRARVDAHLEGVFEIQRRLDGGAVFLGDPPPRPADSGDLMQRSNDMADLLVLALQTGMTRCFSYMFTSPATTHIFSNLGVPDGMHKTVHDGHWERTRAITAYHMDAYARFLDKLAATLDPTGTSLLDRALVYGTSEYGEGYKHSTREMPVVLAGGACGGLARGVHVRDPGGNISRVQLTMLQALGLPFDSFGFNGGQTSDPYTELL